MHKAKAVVSNFRVPAITMDTIVQIGANGTEIKAELDNANWRYEEDHKGTEFIRKVT